MVAAFYVGYAPTQRSGVLRTGAGVAPAGGAADE